MLLTYFRDSKYKVLLDWVSVSYPKKLELSFDKTKAVQQTKLKLPSGSTKAQVAFGCAHTQWCPTPGLSGPRNLALVLGRDRVDFE
eukprot:scaffold33586_cov152-Isochrysis_galbana.AAC.1